jgi:hypothetical protein
VSIELLDRAVSALGDLLPRVVFVGGATVGLWFTDPAARAPRITFDVDVVVEVTTLGAYERFQHQLRRRGFVEDVESGVIGRFTNAEHDLVLDAMPMEGRLGGRFTEPDGRRRRRSFDSLEDAVGPPRQAEIGEALEA